MKRPDSSGFFYGCFCAFAVLTNNYDGPIAPALAMGAESPQRSEDLQQTARAAGNAQIETQILGLF